MGEAGAGAENGRGEGWGRYRRMMFPNVSQEECLADAPGAQPNDRSRAADHCSWVKSRVGVFGPISS